MALFSVFLYHIPMIYLMHGSHHEKARDKARALTDALKARRPDALFYRITTENYEENPIASLIAQQGLFESKYIVFYDNVFESKEIKEEILGALPEIKESDNIFMFLEKELDKKSVEKITKHAEKVQEFTATEPKKKKEYNPFAISDALLTKDKKKLWMILMEAKKKGNAAEEIHGIIWWQVKALKLASVAKDAKEADLSPYVFSKTKAAAHNFSHEQIGGMLFDLVTMYHEAHRGEADLWVEIERWGLRM
jgi:DNA polymerase III delta subunit